MLKFMLVMSVSLNAVLMSALVMSPEKAETHVAEAGTAYLVVTDQLKKVIGPQSRELMWSKYCPHITGNLVAFNSTSRKVQSEEIVDDTPLRIESAYRYDAQLSVECSPFDLNCYRFDNLAVQQKKSLIPKL
jgi:hypothetical protein